ncbi:MAG TPA: hypothetical protein VIL16_00990 [Trebonia sp.]
MSWSTQVRACTPDSWWVTPCSVTAPQTAPPRNMTTPSCTGTTIPNAVTSSAMWPMTKAAGRGGWRHRRRDRHRLRRVPAPLADPGIAGPGHVGLGTAARRGRRGLRAVRRRPVAARPPVRPGQPPPAAARPLGRNAAARLLATARQASWRLLAALPPLALIGYCCWRVGEQVTAGLNPNFTANAWGGPTFLGAMACHYLDIALIIGACGWLLDKILSQPARRR